MNATGQTPLIELQRRLALAQQMAQNPGESATPAGAALRGLAQILAARNAGKLTTEIDTEQKAQQQADLAALQALYAGQQPDIAAFNDPRMAALALQYITEQNAPKSPVALGPGEVLLDPTTYEQLASGGPAPPRMVATGVPGMLYDQSSGNLVDTLAAVMTGTPGAGTVANPMGVNIDAPQGAPAAVPGAGGWRETPGQERAAQADIAAQGREDAARLARETARANKEAEVEIAREEQKRQNLAAQPDLETQNQIFLDTITDPNFEGAVGWMDNLTGRVGEQFGSKEGVLGARVGRLGSTLVLQAAQSLSGALSDRDIQLLMESAPGRASSPQTWRDWYSTEYLPRINAGRKKLGLPGFADPFKEGKQSGRLQFDDGTEVQFE